MNIGFNIFFKNKVTLIYVYLNEFFSTINSVHSNFGKIFCSLALKKWVFEFYKEVILFQSNHRYKMIHPFYYNLNIYNKK